MLEEAERALPLPLANAAFGVVAGGRQTDGGSREAKAREGECPREDETQESQDGTQRRNPHVQVSTGSGSKPLERRRRCGSGDPAATRQPQEGMRRREAGAIAVVSSSEGVPPRRARLRNAGEAVPGRKASRRAGTARTQRDPGGGSPGSGGSGRLGCVEWGENLGRAVRGVAPAIAARGNPGETLQRGRSSEGADPMDPSWPAPCVERPRGGGNREAGARNP
jgi:hypothetical protein